MNQFVQIGKIRKNIGTKGYIKLDADEIFSDSLGASGHVFIKKNGSYIPFFIEEIFFNGNEWEILFEDFTDNPEMAKQFSGYAVWLREKDIKSIKYETHNRLLNLSGFSVLSAEDNSLIGSVLRIDEYPQQLIAVVETLNGEKLIPINDTFLVDLNENSRELWMNIPSGLLDI